MQNATNDSNWYVTTHVNECSPRKEMASFQDGEISVCNTYPIFGHGYCTTYNYRPLFYN